MRKDILLMLSVLTLGGCLGWSQRQWMTGKLMTMRDEVGVTTQIFVEDASLLSSLLDYDDQQRLYAILDRTMQDNKDNQPSFWKHPSYQMEQSCSYVDGRYVCTPVITKDEFAKMKLSGKLSPRGAFFEIPGHICRKFVHKVFGAGAVEKDEREGVACRKKRRE